MHKSSQPGAFLLSIDTEMAWGGVHNGSYVGRMAHYERTRDAIDRLLQLLQKYEIRATWAIVGHLFLDSCESIDGVKHPEIVRPTYPWFRGDWFDADPATNAGEDPAWFGPDIIEKILEAEPPQEIGSHGFSHLIAGDPGCSRECFESEIKTCVEHGARKNIELKSFVFPRNSVGHLDVLAEQGFNAYRGSVPAWYTRFPAPLRPWARLVDSLLPVTPPVTTPEWHDSLCDLPASYFYPHREGWSKLIPLGLTIHKINLGLEKAARENSMFHLWFHAFNLASDPDRLLDGLETVFERVASMREAGRLSNPVMGELAAKLAGDGATSGGVVTPEVSNSRQTVAR